MVGTEGGQRETAEPTPLPAFIYSNDGELVDANGAAVTFLGAVDRDQLLATQAGDFTHPDSKAAVERRGQRLFGDREPVPPMAVKLVDVAGAVKEAVFVSSPITYEGEPAVRTVAHSHGSVATTQADSEAVAPGDDPFDDVLDTVRQLMDGMYGPEAVIEPKRDEPAPTRGDSLVSSTAIHQADDRILLSAEIPAATRDDLAIEYAEEVLTIWDRRRALAERINLPVPVETENLDMGYNNGVLDIELRIKDASAD